MTTSLFTPHSFNTRIALHPAHRNLLQRKCACGGTPGPSGECEQCRQKRPGLVQRSATGTQSPSVAPATVHEVLRSPGRPLDAETRAFMEPRLGHDFSQVRVHTDAKAAQAAGSIGASAFTAGQDIVFGSRQYAPRTGKGQRLLAHELTHVIQQESSTSAMQPDQLGPINDRLEAEASHMAEQVTTGNTVKVTGHTGPMVQRAPGWSTDTLEIRLLPVNPTTAGQISYTENGFLSQRMSSKLPHYRGPFCQNVTLPFKCDVEFRVDYSDEPRPQPFTPPQVSVLFEFSPGRGGFSFSKSDNNPSYAGQDLPLKTNFGTHFDFSLDDNGPFHMKFQLADPDTGITRIYDDTINVEAKRPCA